MTDTESPRPFEPDVQLSVFLHGQRFDYAACLSAATVFIQEWQARHHPGAVAIIAECEPEIPRLPCESLYLGP
ncbi:hypothetical protein ACFXNW_01880 [Nocardia sp. NPDC059180]|uniref:hypothetical protein n=1 Tax=Nocardia sp. NPDC059180 TaxID=3346761 RepID=UPI0036CD7138